MNNKLATVQIVKDVKNCPNSDNLDIVQVLGWQVVTKRNQFKIGDLAIYIVIDTVLPDHPEFEFLRNKNFLIKPIRLRGQNSAGILFPTDILSKFGYNFKESLYEGMDVTDIIKVVHYEKPLSTELAGQAYGGMPSDIIITDELNLRNYPEAINELHGRSYYITLKVDGSSGTFFIKDGKFGVCSRRVHLKESDTNGFWKIAKKFDIENAIRKTFPDQNIAIQGEVYGPGVQKNPLEIKELSINLFNIFNINSRYYYDYDTIASFCNYNNIPMVKIINNGSIFGYTLEDLIKITNIQKYDSGKFAEGIVIRPKEPFISNILNKVWSGKIINENYKD